MFGEFSGPSGRGERLLGLERALTALALRALRRNAACHKALELIALPQHNLYLPLWHRARGTVQRLPIINQESCPNACRSKQLVSPSGDGVQLTPSPLFQSGVVCRWRSVKPSLELNTAALKARMLDQVRTFARHDILPEWSGRW